MDELVKDLLSTDATLTAILTGGVHTGRELTRRSHAAAFDGNQEILPSALVKETSEIGDNAPLRSSVQVVTIYLYERDGYASIKAATNRIYDVLHDHKFCGGGRTELLSAIPQTEDGALECSLAVLRYGRAARRS